MPLKIYFSAPIKGDRSNLQTNKFIVDFLKEAGYTILTEHVVSENAVEKGMSPKQIYLRDMKWLEECRVLIAEVSYPSLGVGFEIAKALLLGKSVICLLKKELKEKCSLLIRGIQDPKFEIIEYTDLSELKVKLLRTLSNLETQNKT